MPAEIVSMMRDFNSEISWHGLETVAPENATFDDKIILAGMDFDVQRSYVRFQTSHNPADIKTFEDKVVLFNSKTGAPISVVSAHYKVVQPRQIMEFFREFCDANALTLDTAGVLARGTKVWANASTGEAFMVDGLKDKIKQNILLATSFDGSMRTMGMHTNIRTVCANTLRMNANSGQGIRINHRTEFNETQVKLDLGLLDAEWKAHCELARAMHQVKVDTLQARKFVAKLVVSNPALVENDDDATVALDGSRVGAQILDAIKNGRGAEDTVWGLVNGVTYMTDWVRGRSFDTRMNSALFGQSADLKAKAWGQAQEMLLAA